MDSPIKSYSSNNSLSTNQLLDREFSKKWVGIWNRKIWWERFLRNMKYYLVSWRTSSIVFAQNLEVQPSCSAAFTCNHFLLAYNFTYTLGQPDRWQWRWWNLYVGDFMMVTDFRCWSQNHYVGDFNRYVGDFGRQHSESVTNISNLSPTYLTSNIRHQHRSNPLKR